MLQPQHEEVDRKPLPVKKEEALEAKQEPMETEDTKPLVKVEPKEEGEDGTNGTSAAQNRRKSRNRNRPEKQNTSSVAFATCKSFSVRPLQRQHFGRDVNVVCNEVTPTTLFIDTAV